MNVIRSRAHNIFTEAVNKVALSCKDDKREILEDGITTLALGHFKSKRSLSSRDLAKLEIFLDFGKLGNLRFSRSEKGFLVHWRI